VELAPDNPLALNNLAYLLAESGRGAEAVGYAERAYKLTPTPACADTLGWAYHQAGRDREAVPLLETAAKALPQERTVATHLAAARGGAR
jgi:cellulose synthase operon protein C